MACRLCRKPCRSALLIMLNTSPETDQRSARICTGISGLDEILGGGLTSQRVYLLEGNPGAGKTTLALQFLLEGAKCGRRGLYITLSETANELRAVAASHGWSLDQIDLFELVSGAGLGIDAEQSILYPSEFELGETTKGVMSRVDAIKPELVVFDSLSEMRLLAQNPLRYRRQILALKHFFSSRNCTVILLDDRTSEAGDLQLYSISHGVISLEHTPREYGEDRRRLRVTKMRGIRFSGGYHDFNLDTGGLKVFPRVVAGDEVRDYVTSTTSSGSAELDEMLGGGLVPGTSTLLIGPSGVGKTTTAVRCVLSAIERGQRTAFFLFDEGLHTMLARAATLGMDLRPALDAGSLQIFPIDPAQMSPGEFAHRVRKAVESEQASFVVVDSINAYLQAMPDEKFLMLQMHELLSYLSRHGVTTILVLAQHGLIGEVQTTVDLSYLSDAILMFRYFEAKGSVRSAISVVKSRATNHERTIREFRVAEGGIQVGPALADFEGVLSGLPTYRGATPLLQPLTATP